jgi:hypothetical protein
MKFNSKVHTSVVARKGSITYITRQMQLAISSFSSGVNDGGEVFDTWHMINSSVIIQDRLLAVRCCHVRGKYRCHHT